MLIDTRRRAVYTDMSILLLPRGVRQEIQERLYEGGNLFNIIHGKIQTAILRSTYIRRPVKVSLYQDLLGREWRLYD